VPNLVTAQHFEDLRVHLADDQIVEMLAMESYMGFANRWNDTLATELEAGPLAFAQRNLVDKGWTVGQHQHRRFDAGLVPADGEPS
jgi:hypothetical protein